jgi:hypothetical protein
MIIYKIQRRWWNRSHNGNRFDLFNLSRSAFVRDKFLRSSKARTQRASRTHILMNHMILDNHVYVAEIDLQSEIRQAIRNISYQWCRKSFRTIRFFGENKIEWRELINLEIFASPINVFTESVILFVKNQNSLFKRNLHQNVIHNCLHFDWTHKHVFL